MLNHKMFDGLVKMAKVGIIATGVVAVLAVAGWVMNLYKLIQLALHYQDQVGQLALHMVGILPPVGAIVGWF